MGIIIEDGSIVANANSYATVKQLEDYALLRGITLPNRSADRIRITILGADYTESFRKKYQGCKVSALQSMQFPREGVVIDGFDSPSDSIPFDLKLAQMQASIEYITTDMLPSTGKNIKREKVDVIDITYQDGDGALTAPSFPKVDQYLDALLKSNISGTVIPVR